MYKFRLCKLKVRLYMLLHKKKLERHPRPVVDQKDGPYVDVVNLAFSL